MSLFRAPRGVTLLEVVISMTIITIIFGASAVGFSNISRTLANFSTDHDIMTALALAARRARANRDNTSWGVYIPYDETTRKTSNMIVFAGLSYAARDTSKDLILTVNNDILFTTVDFSGSAPDATNSHEIVFQQFSGATSYYGSATVTWFNEQHTVTIDQRGVPVE